MGLVGGTGMTASLRALAGSLRNLYTLGAANRRRSKLGSLIVPTPTSLLKRLVVGRPFRSDRLSHTLLPKRIALPIFASDPLSSVAYATQEILLILTLGGLAYLYLTPLIAAAVVLLLAVVVLSYRQVVQAYPSGGGSYEVVSTNLGPRAGLVVAAALLVDYVMTVAVSVAAGVDNIISAVPELNPHRVAVNIGFILVLTAMNLRGVRESGRTFAVPTYAFIAGVMLMIAIGVLRTLMGDAPQAESANYGVHAEHIGLNALAISLLALRAFSSGCTALTGVEAISNGVPAFRKPKALNAARTMTSMGVLAITMFVGVTALALISHTRVVENTCDLIGFAGNCATDPQRTVIAQIAAAVFGNNSIMFFYMQAATALILILAANTAYNGFPLLSSILAQDRYLPRQLHTRGDRLAYSNGIILLAVIACGLIYAFDGSTTRLIQLYILGVFTSFTLCQTGMVWALEPAVGRCSHTRRAVPDKTCAGHQCVRRMFSPASCWWSSWSPSSPTARIWSSSRYLCCVSSCRRSTGITRRCGKSCARPMKTSRQCRAGSTPSCSSRAGTRQLNAPCCSPRQRSPTRSPPLP